ncbi:MAG: hypothetical protein ACT6Q5_05050 [Sphingopyxis solisilvae]|uniref:hypothetical protein n=1 Tax=Sphingopyxis solisilvae TaxID=1886788 RepID=UPI004036F07D
MAGPVFQPCVFFLFRTKTQSHEDVVRTAKRLSFATARPAASLTGLMSLLTQALFFVALCLCAKRKLAPPWLDSAGPLMLKQVQHDEVG